MSNNKEKLLEIEKKIDKKRYELHHHSSEIDRYLCSILYHKDLISIIEDKIEDLKIEAQYILENPEND